MSQPIGQREGPLLADFQDAKDLHLVTDELLWVDFPGHVQWCRSIFSFSFALTSKTQLRAFRSFLLLSVGALCALDVSTCSGRFYVLSMDTLRALDASMFLRWSGVWLSLSLVGAHAGSGWWRQASHPVWTGSALAPGGARPDFTLRSTFTDLFPSMPCLRRFSYLSVTSSLSLSRLGTETRSTEVGLDASPGP